jgi:CubicO group peptidase (beta-lactamase class C family)
MLLPRLPLLILLLALAPAAIAADAPPTSPDKLIGLWGSERVFGPLVQGELTLDGRSSDWHASIAGFDVAVQHGKDGIAFTLPAQQGDFHGQLSTDGKTVSGFWIQPTGVTLGTRYATPVVLHGVQTGVWSGAVKPLVDRVSLYLLVSRAADGSLKGFIRNPEFNLGRFRSYTLGLEGDHVTLDNPQRKDEQSQGLYDVIQDTLSVTLDGIGAFDLTRRDTGIALGFYPATPAVTQYSYRQPVLEDDGWKTATLAAAGLDPKPLSALVQQILDTRADSSRTPYIQSLLVARHGKLALEEYFYGFDRERTHDSRSAGKTFAGTLIGIALDHGTKFKLDTPVVSLFPEYPDLSNPDPRKQKITVEDLLTMDSGLSCDDNDDASPGNEDTMQGQDQQPDWYKYTLDLPMLDEPGDKKALYCTGAINLLGGILRNTTHMRLMEFFQQYYAGPLDIHDYHMNLMPNGDAYIGGGIYLRPRDMLKLGQLYLDGGRWNGRQVLSRKWTELATTQHSYFPASDYVTAHGYGYTWHLHDVTAGGRTYRMYDAVGNGGQFVMVVPALDLAVVITAGNYGNFPTWRKFEEELLPQYIIAAAR